MEGSAEDSTRREHRGCGFYLRQHHKLILRHTETLEVHSEERTADWCLQVDFELPTDPAAHWGPANGEHFFMFPLLYLRKSDARTQFGVNDEQGQPLVVPTREECDTISTAALAQAMNMLTPAGVPPLPIAALVSPWSPLCRCS